MSGVNFFQQYNAANAAHSGTRMGNWLEEGALAEETGLTRLAGPLGKPPGAGAGHKRTIEHTARTEPKDYASCQNDAHSWPVDVQPRSVGPRDAQRAAAVRARVGRAIAAEEAAAASEKARFKGETTHRTSYAPEFAVTPFTEMDRNDAPVDEAAVTYYRQAVGADSTVSFKVSSSDKAHHARVAMSTERSVNPHFASGTGIYAAEDGPGRAGDIIFPGGAE